MTHPKLITGVLVGAALALLAACSSDPTGTSPNQLLKDIVTNDVFGRGPTQTRDISELTRAAISEVDFPLILVTIPEVEAVSTATITAVKGRTVTWVAVDRAGLILKGPVLFGTRGVGPDLLSAETSALVALLDAGGNGTLSRTLRHLDGLDQIIAVTYQCTVRNAGSETIVVLERNHSTRRMQETCTAANGQGFENTYWIGSDNTLWKSQQWVSERAGYLVTERLVK